MKFIKIRSIVSSGSFRQHFSLLRMNSVLIVLVMIFLSGCEQKDIWKQKNDNKGESIVLPDVTITSFYGENGEISMTWTDPADTEFTAVEITCTDITGSAQVSPGVQAYTQPGLTNGNTYTVTLTVTDSSGSASEGESLSLTLLLDGSKKSAHFIYTAEELNAIRGGVAGYSDWNLVCDYYLKADIDLSGYSTGPGWDPVGNTSPGFEGNFYGNDHTISSLTIDRSGTDYVGLFGIVSGSVNNVNFSNVNITGHNNAGALAGSNEGAGIKNCNVTAGIIQGTESVGGLIGLNNGNITGSNVSSTVDGNMYIGILAGRSLGGTITYCHSNGTITGVLDNIGGLVGRNEGIVSNSDSSGTVNGNQITGGLVGYTNNTISDSSSSCAVYGERNVGGFSGTVNGGNIDSCYATGTVTGLVTTTSENIGGFIGMISNASINESYAEGDVVILNSTSRYIGGFIGHNNAGTGFNITACHASGSVSGSGTIDYAGGLIGYDSSTNLLVNSSYAEGDVTSTGTNIGGLIGNSAGDLTNCYANGSVTGEGVTGGLVGTNDGGTLTDCHATGDVNGGTGNAIGGLVGVNNGGILTDCDYTTGIINGGFSYVGGLVGNNDSGSSIQQCRTLGPNINVDGSYVGGLVGWNGGFIIESYATYNITGVGGSRGGLVGFNSSTGLIKESFTTGNVNGTVNVGGLVGNNEGTITICYTRGDVSGSASSSGGIVGLHDAPDSSYLSICYATGLVISGSGAGLIGNLINAGSYEYSYYNEINIWNTEGISRSLSQMRDSVNYSADWLFGTDWLIDGTQAINNGFPYLADNPPDN